jgi:hypothetical protein
VLVGFTLGLIVAIANGYYADATISEYKSIVAEREAKYEELLAKSHTEIETLSKMNETLKQHVKTKKVTKSDGTVVEETDTDTNTNTVTETSIRQTIEVEYERKLYQEKSRHQEEINKLTNRKLRIGIGYTTDLEYYGHGSYNIYGPISVGGGVTSGGTVMLDIGIQI